MTRRPTISTEENRIAIATMWVVCIAGTTQDDFASATLSVVFTSQFANECKNSLLSGAYHVGHSLRLLERPAPQCPVDAQSSPGLRRGWRRRLALCLGPRLVAGLNPRRPFGIALVSAAAAIRRVEDGAVVGHDETDAATIATIAERAMDDHDMLARRECCPAHRRNALQKCRRGSTLEDPLLAGAVLDEQQRVRAVIGPADHRPLNHFFARRIEHGEAVVSLDHRGCGAADRQHCGEYEEPVHRSLCCFLVGELFAERRIETKGFAGVLRVAVLAWQIRGQVRATAGLNGAANVVEALFARKRHLRGAFSRQRGILVRAALPPSHPT